MIQPEIHLAPVSPTRQTGFSPRQMVFAVLQRGEVEEVLLLFQVLLANSTCTFSKYYMYFKSSSLNIDKTLSNIVIPNTRSAV